MGNQAENQQYKKPQAPPAAPEGKDSDFKKQGVDQGKKTWTSTKGKEANPGSEDDDASPQSE